MTWLKQSTAITLKIGPFVDEDDGKTAETGLAIAQADVRLSKNGGDIAQKTESTACTHNELGIYGCPVDTTDTGTLGRLQLWVHESGALPVWHEFMVVPANVWDSMFGADKLQVDTTQIEGSDATDQINAAVDAALDTAIPGSPTADSINERVKAIDVLTEASGTGDLAAIKTDAARLTAVRAAILTDWIDGGRLDLLLDAILADTNELQTDDIPALITALNDPTAATITDAVWDEATSGHQVAGTTGKALTNAATALGAGAIKFTYTLTSSVDSTPIPGADVWVTSDKAGNNVLASGTTNSSGKVVFYLDSGTIYVWRQKSGWNFDETNPDTETVA